MSKQLVVDTFEREKIPPPHASNADGTGAHCKIVSAIPVCFLECQCGYHGFAHVVDGKPVCPAHLARVEQQKRETNQTLDTAAITPNIQQLIDAAVQKALAGTGKVGN